MWCVLIPPSDFWGLSEIYLYIFLLFILQSSCYLKSVHAGNIVFCSLIFPLVCCNAM
jgi:hypothetical protein